METQSEIDEVVLSNVVESLLGKIRTNLDISMQEDFIREVCKILPNEEDQIIQVLRELENRLDSVPNSSLTTH